MESASRLRLTNAAVEPITPDPLPDPLADLPSPCSSATSKIAPDAAAAPAEGSQRKALLQKLAVLLLAFAGISLLVVLLVREGAGDILRAISTARWWLLAIAAYHVLPLLLDTFTWWVIIPSEQRLSFRLTLFLRWIGESVSNLVPASSLGGDILRARLAWAFGVPLNLASASVIVHITIGLLGQIVFTLIGLLALISTAGRSNVTVPCLIGIGIAVVSVGGFYQVQRFGIFRLIQIMVSQIAKDGFLQTLVAKGGRLDSAVQEIYQRRRSILWSFGVSVLYWLAGSVEVWLALRAIGSPATFSSALIFESVGQGIRSVLFFIPGALGVQEGGYMLVGGLIGVPADAALAISLIRRVRELILGLPALVAWQITEGNRFLRKTRTESC